MNMMKNSLWGAFGIAISFGVLALIKTRTGLPVQLPFGFWAIWIAGFVLLILAARLMDIVFRGAFTRRPGMERFGTGILIGAWIFAGVFLHS